MTGAKTSWHCCLIVFFLLCSQAGMGRTDSLHHACLNSPASADRMHAANNSQQADFFLVSPDSILNDENRSQIHELQTIHETEKNKIEILKLQQKERISNILIRSGIVFIGMGIMVVFFFFKYIQKRRKLAEQQVTLHQTEMQKMEVLLNANKQELTGKALSLLKSDELIKQLKADLQKLLPKADMITSHELRSALRLLKSNENNQALWVEFEKRFDELNDGFISKLVRRYPDLTPGEIRMCAMLRLQLSSKEIAELSKRSFRTIEYVRSNIRKKMDLKAGENLTKHILNI